MVWVGRDDNKPAGLTGSSGALAIWGRTMKALDPLPLSLLPPDNVRHRWVEQETGFISAEGCPGAVSMPFIRGSEPDIRASCTEGSGIGGFIHDLFD